MATEHQIKLLEKRLRGYRKTYLGPEKPKDLNEAGTRICVNEFLQDVLGYAFETEIKTEYAIKGGYADYVVQLLRKQYFVVEVKAMEIDLNEGHLRQARHYASDEGLDWIVLFNGKQFQLHRVVRSSPTVTCKVFDYDLSDLSQLKAASKDLVHLTKNSVQKGELVTYWKRFDALAPASLIKTIYTADVIKAIRLKVKKNSGISFDSKDVFDAVHELVINTHEAIKPKVLK